MAVTNLMVWLLMLVPVIKQLNRKVVSCPIDLWLILGLIKVQPATIPQLGLRGRKSATGLG